jgi:hypothetical protein
MGTTESRQTHPPQTPTAPPPPLPPPPPPLPRMCREDEDEEELGIRLTWMGGWVGEPRTVEALRAHDVRLLQHLGVKYICDLMVEQRKMRCVSFRRCHALG